MRLASYGSAAQRSKTITFTKDVEIPLEGKHVLIVEDIVDSGFTLSYLSRVLSNRGAASVRICTLLDKPERRAKPITADYVAFPSRTPSWWAMVWTMMKNTGTCLHRHFEASVYGAEPKI